MSPDLSKVSVLVKTFLRDQHLSCAIGGIWHSLPESRIIVVDDGDASVSKSMLYRRLRSQGHTVVELPFDSGFGAKSNAGAAACQTEYLLIGSDDFDFWADGVRQGVERLVTVLDNVTEVAIVSGRVNNNPYEGWLHIDGDRVREERIRYDQSCYAAGVEWHPCDLTVNYSLIRASILGPDKVHWFDNVKIGGGEHGAFFVEVKRAGHKVAWVPGVNIKEQEGKPTDPRYYSFRGRASQPGRAAFRAIGVREYTLFDGTVERA